MGVLAEGLCCRLCQWSEGVGAPCLLLLLLLLLLLGFESN
jgi:hypothetical protein